MCFVCLLFVLVSIWRVTPEAIASCTDEAWVAETAVWPILINMLTALNQFYFYLQMARKIL